MSIPWFVAGIVLAISASAGADVVYSTLDEWDGETRTAAWDSVAEVLAAPDDATTLSTFRFWGFTEPGSSQSYRVLVYEWSEELEHVVGDELYAGEEVPVVEGEFVLYDEMLDLDVTAGLQYAVIVDFLFDTSGTGLGVVEDSGFAPGVLALTNDVFTEPWLVPPGDDLAFEAAFVTAPASGTLGLLAAAAVVGSSRRRRDPARRPPGR